MGYKSVTDLIQKYTAKGQFWRNEWQKVTGANVFAAGRWYDTTFLAGSLVGTSYGDLVTNGVLNSASATSAPGWTLGANWSSAAGSISKTGGAANNASQTSMTVVAGHSYLLIFNLSSVGGGGGIQASIGGTAGTNRTTSGVYVERIGPVAGTGTLVFTPSSAATTATIQTVSCVDCLRSAALSDAQLAGAMQHGGNVSTLTKHLLNAGIMSTAATTVPGTWILCDMLLAYPGIDMNLNTEQTLTTTITLPRYTDGVGVRAFMMPSSASIGSTAHNLRFKYTNTVPTSGRTCPTVLAPTVSAIPTHLYHSGAAVNNYGPFIPLAGGDKGITKVDSVWTTAAPGNVNVWGTVVLCKPLCSIPTIAVRVMADRDFVSQLPSFPRIVDGACLGLLYMPSGATVAGSVFYGFFDFGWA